MRAKCKKKCICLKATLEPSEEKQNTGNGSESRPCSPDRHPVVTIEIITVDSINVFGTVRLFLRVLTTALCSTRALT